LKITSTGLTIPFIGIKKQYSAIRNEILDATDEVLRSGQVMNGNYTAEFENWLARRNHVKYAVTCHSGTQALEIIAEFARIYVNPAPNPPRALVPSMTYVATANAFGRAGYEIVLLDTNYYGMANYEKINRDLSYQIIVQVGLYGAAVSHERVDNIKGMATIVEDAAQHWLSNNGRRTGWATAISFDPMKNLGNYGNGGAVVTDNVNLLEFARVWRDNGKPNHDRAGTNSRMSEIDCAQLLVKTRYIDAWQQRRAVIVRYWMDRLQGSGIRSLIDDSNYVGHAYHKFVIDTDCRDQLQQHLKSHKIETRIHYQQPVHELPAYQQYPGPDILSGASALSRRCLSLPLYPELTDLEVEYVIDQVLNFSLEKHSWPTKPSRKIF
jgi:dTDP-4-amino-4,6-dideoxygalactose transaminase